MKIFAYALIIIFCKIFKIVSKITPDSEKTSRIIRYFFYLSFSVVRLIFHEFDNNSNKQNFCIVQSTPINLKTRWFELSLIRTFV